MRVTFFHARGPFDAVAFIVTFAVAFVVTMVGVGFPAGAWADDQRQRAAAAEALFQEGRSLLMAGKPEQACPKLEESQRLDPATGTLMAVALCQEQQGKLASAWTAFADVEGRSRLDGRADRERTARDHGNALRPRLSTLTLQIAAQAATAPGLAISVDSVAIGRGAWNVAIPLDGGLHVVEASAPGKKSWRSTVSVAREQDHVRVDIPSLSAAGDNAVTASPPEAPVPSQSPPRTADEEPVAPTPTPTPGVRATSGSTRAPGPSSGQDAAGGRSTATATPAPASTSGGGHRTAAIVLAGAGALALAAGVSLAIDAKHNYDAARADCVEAGCPAEPYGRVQDARTRGNWATVISAVGGAAIVTGAALWLWAPRAQESASLAGGPRIERVGVQPGGGLAIAGSF